MVATFSLTILGTFLTRSGVLQSVHSFSTSTIGPLLLAFFGLVVVVGVGLIAWRGDRLRSPGGIDSPLSREGAFLANNLLFVVFAFVVLLGTVFPLLYEALESGTQVAVGAPYFNRLVVPVGLGLLFLMAVAPALPWRKTHARGDARPAGRARRRRGRWSLLVCVAAGVRGVEPLLAFGLGAFAAASAGRALVLSVRGAWRGCARSRRDAGRGRCSPGGVASSAGPTVAWWSTSAWWSSPSGWPPPPRSASVARSSWRRASRPPSPATPSTSWAPATCGDAVPLAPRGGPAGRRRQRCSPRPSASSASAPSRRHAGHRLELDLDDVYLTIDSIPDSGGSWTFGVVVQPLVSVAVDRWRPDGARLGAVGHPRPPPPADRPGVGPGVPGAVRSGRRTRGPSGDDRTPVDARSGRPRRWAPRDAVPVGPGEHSRTRSTRRPRPGRHPHGPVGGGRRAGGRRRDWSPCWPPVRRRR